MSERTTLGELADAKGLIGRLTEFGLSGATASERAEMFAAAAGTLLKAGVPGDAAARAFFVPGRLEVLGKRTDYAGGRSIVAATERGFCVVAADRDDATVRVFADAAEEKAQFRIDPDLSPTVGHWSNYPMTVARRLARNFRAPLRGAEIAFRNDLPPAAGMSSSSALLVSSYLVLAGVNGLERREEYRTNIDSPEALAGYLGTIENGQSFGTLAGDKGVGTFGGSEDHTAILCCRPGQLAQYSYCPVRAERSIELPPEYVFAVASSGVVAEKTGSAREKYNRASALARAAVEGWNAATGRSDAHLAAAVVLVGADSGPAHLAAAVASAPDAPGRLREALAAAEGAAFPPEQLVQRFEHFFAESEEIIPAASDALASGDVEEFGRQVDCSQKLAETLLGNQVEQTVFLARSAREVGAAAASAFGAGFGGSVWALVKANAAERMVEEWSERYGDAFPQASCGSHFMLTRPGTAAFAL